MSMQWTAAFAALFALFLGLGVWWNSWYMIAMGVCFLAAAAWAGTETED